MYKFLLCLRYLRTRYIALASIISVMLGVATMIVVNSVMDGFTSEMQNRIHGILSDLVVESRSLDGFCDAQGHMDQIRQMAGDSIEAMTPTVVVPSMLNFEYGDQWITRQVQLVGIDETTHSQVSDFGKYLQHPENRRQMSFALHESGYDTKDHQGDAEGHERKQMRDAGWIYRRWIAEKKAFQQQFATQRIEPLEEPAQTTLVNAPAPLSDDSIPTTIDPGAVAGQSAVMARSSDQPVVARSPDRDTLATGAEEIATMQADPAAASASTESGVSLDPFLQHSEMAVFDPAKQQHTGAVVGIAMVSFRGTDGDDRFLTLPGGDVKLTFPTTGRPPKAANDTFTIVDLYESKMSEYDSSFVFVPIKKLQELRGMIDPTSGAGFVNSIQIKLKPGASADQVRDQLRKVFSPDLYGVYTWRDKQGPLLAAVEMETAILNVLLFLIIAVAGFGILAIFLMIVVEKTRDIGILKSLGASSRGVMGIFLTYGLSLGVVGAGVGTALGLLLVAKINEIAALLGRITGRPVFDPSIYYFYKIPTIVDPMTITWIVAGAIAIAVLASILPALRAAMLHPVEALRYE